MKQTIIRSDQSPMNAARWSLDLSCGHEIWVTQSSKPKIGKTVACPQCKPDFPGKPKGPQDLICLTDGCFQRLDHDSPHDPPQRKPDGGA